ncbi:hypothetical protein SEA_GERALT_50 [Mycobacterium phage Geralt]|uniref:Uncharacterized protein n=4 Tax=Cheoctovirus TaxID=1623281 RepID=A0A249XPZ6_9CAUD|nr:gp49 [Mycobacterium phage Pacc40]YP_008410618.1 hypothetical protein N856_gp049 [Mycobacterium phage Daenerys]YP_009958287.1 hypothetical protein I5H49_gp050 [Mycobacterium phage JoeyJr]YP_009961878.1 hypothetical protein I5H84_gp050 [Mycobacterium phage RitaG]YP_010092520.1 hypothetical protein KNT74_gp50 [Mycobacterium phage Geralt]AXQ61690.1 hypothetical protein SEA_NIMBO_49 [Mycobacterium phage Nimbo]AXQ61785.1 hypothetical protein SEA_PHAPPINESS_50 [Mycobacterium phage PHappiness]QEQ
MSIQDSKPSWWDHHQTNWADLPVTTNPPMADLSHLQEFEDLAAAVMSELDRVGGWPFIPPWHWETEPTIWEQVNGDAVVALLRDYLTTGEAA